MKKTSLTEEDWYKKIKTVKSLDDLKEEESFLFHDMAEFFHDLLYCAFHYNQGWDEKLYEVISKVMTAHENFKNYFPEHSDLVIKQYQKAINEFSNFAVECLASFPEDGRRYFDLVASTLISFWEGFLGAQNQFDLGEQLWLTAPYFRNKMASHNINYHLDFPAEFPTRTDYFRVINNLLGNARKSFYELNKENKWVKIFGNFQNFSLKVSVKDNGRGIAPEHLPHIFEKNYSVNNQTGNIHGLNKGLGLYFCKKAVEENGGQITVDSKPGQGTIFSFTIPYNHSK